MTINNIILIMFIFSIICNAIGDALKFKSNANKKVSWYHAFWALALVGVLSIVFLPLDYNFIQASLFIVAYAGLRFGLFDFIYNYVAGNNSLYLGSTAGLDRFLSKIFNTPNKLSVLPAIRVVILAASFALIQYGI